MKFYGEGCSLMSPATDFVPPQNLEAERKLLCACMLDNDVIDDVTTILKADDFYREAHGLYWRAMTWIRSQGNPVDSVSIADTLIRFKQFEKSGGDELLTEVMNSAPHAANAKYHAGIILEKSTSRKLLVAAGEIASKVHANEMTASEVLAWAESRIFSIADGRNDDSTMSLGEMLGRAKVLIDSRKDGEVCGVMSGFSRLDSMTGGFRPGQLVIVAARPGQGKTSLAMQLAMNAAGLNTSLVFSMEMSHEELGLRTLATLAEVDSKAFDDPSGRIFAAMASDEFVTVPPVARLSDSDDRKLIRAICEGSKRNVQIDDKADRSVAQIAAKARRTKRRSGLGILIVDYLSLVDSDGNRSDSRQEHVARNSRAFKKLARNLGVPLVLLSQLNRESEKRTDKRPMLGDLRESGQVEQDADVVLILHRPEYYDPNDRPGLAEVIVAKNRNGPTGTVKLTFRKEFTKFLREEREYGD